MKKTKLFTNLFSLSMVALLLAACGGQTSSTSSEGLTSETPTTSENSVTSEEPTSTSISESSSEDLTTIAVTNTEEGAWVGDTLQITYESNKALGDQDLTFASSDEEVATISESGLITFLKAGNVTISVTLKTDIAVSDNFSLAVKDEMIDQAYGFGNLDFTNIRAENPSVTTTKTNADWPYVEGVFKNVYGQKYYASATFAITEVNYGWTWNRVAIGHRDRPAVEGDHVWRGYNLSYGDASGNQKKSVMMETPNNWGETTDRSQVWGLNGLAQLSFGVDADSVKLSTIRDGNEYFYFVNDKLAWQEKYDQRFLDVDTMPTFVVGDMHATISDFAVETDSEAIDAMLNGAEASRLLYPTYASNVSVDDAAKTITFANAAASWPWNNIKDNAAKSLGDAFSLPAANASVSFDFAVANYVDPDSAALTLTLNQWGTNSASNGPSEAVTFMFGKDSAGITVWNSNGDLPVTPNMSLAYPTVLQATNSVTITRTIVEGNTYFTLEINGETVNLNSWYFGGYALPYTMSFGSRQVNATVSNYQVSILD